MGRTGIALSSSFSTIFFVSFISSSELSAVMSNLGEKLSQEEVKSVGVVVQKVFRLNFFQVEEMMRSANRKLDELG